MNQGKEDKLVKEAGKVQSDKSEKMSKALYGSQRSKYNTCSCCCMFSFVAINSVS